MDLKSLVENKKSRLKACKTVVTTALGRRYEEVNGERRELPPATPFVVDEKPDLQIACVTPGLFLSSQDPVANVEILQEHEISRVLSIGVEATVKFDGIKYYHCDLLDLPESDIALAMEKCGKIIKENRGENILVHCNAGVSRSPAIVISYLMTAEKLSYSEARDKVKNARDCIKPNEGFVRQLKMLRAVPDVS